MSAPTRETVLAAAVPGRVIRLSLADEQKRALRDREACSRYISCATHSELDDARDSVANRHSFVPSAVAGPEHFTRDSDG